VRRPNSPSETVTLLVASEYGFERLERELAQLGWRRDPDPTAPEPIFPGEPELASWSQSHGPARLVYGYHPAVGLRVLRGHGADAIRLLPALAARVPLVDPSGVLGQLESANPEDLLYGILATRELERLEYLPALHALSVHPDETVASEATDAVRHLLGLASETSGQWLRAERRHRPGQSVLFPRLGDAAFRRQILRWMMREYSSSTEGILEVLRTALEDEDWEVRMTAMLAAGRLDAKPLRSVVNRLPIPDGAKYGLDVADHHLLAAARQVVVARLDGLLDEARFDDTLARMPGVPASFVRCVVSADAPVANAACLFIHSLTTACEPRVVAPDRLPPGVEKCDAALFLTATASELVWVPSVPHWLGDDSAKLPAPNPVRRVEPEQGFLIARWPLSMADADRLLRLPALGADGAALFAGTAEMAARLVEALQRPVEGQMSVALPTADQLEMALRGSDGRRFPWGNGLEAGARPLASPWGLTALGTGPGEWTASVTVHGERFVSGGAAARCATRRLAAAGARHAVRPVLTWAAS